MKQLLATRDEALLQLRRTSIKAPIDGIVSKVPVPGTYATAGVPVMVVVADTDLWIEANFKETELTHVRPGQPADHQRRHLSRTAVQGDGRQHQPRRPGAEFSLLPPQNATGNWVKVVQRIPVRIALSTAATGSRRCAPA